MTPKHAYLIIAHGEEPVLRVLLEMLDDERNDVYLHIDAKSEAFYCRMASYQMKRASLFVLKNRIPVYWGHVSQVRVEYLLFHTAFSRNPRYAYFHLLSGVDLPIKSQDRIHDFFDAHPGKEFVEFWNSEGHLRDLNRKVTLHYFFVKYKKGGNAWQHGITAFVRNSLVALQKVTRFRRKKEVEFKKGSNWVSLTPAFVRYMFEREDWVMRRFRRTLCPDEIFIQTLLWNSPFRKNLYKDGVAEQGAARKIEWHRGSPHVWGREDLKELLDSDAMFARKFSSKDMEVVEALRQIICGSDRH